MATTLQSSRNAQYSPSFAVDPQRHLLVCDGINQNRRWNGVSGSTTKLGIDYPTVAASVTTPGSGNAEAGDYLVCYRYKDADGNYSSLSPVATVTAAANDKFEWTITSSSDTRVTHVELLRSLVDAANTLYLVTTLNAGTTTYTTDTLSDAALAANTALVIDNGDGTTNANRFNPPPTTRFVEQYLDRTFYGGRATYDWGSVEVTNGSPTVQGRGTQWTAEMDGWKMYFPGSTTEYTVDSLNTSTQVITLTANFGGTTNLFSGYALRPEKNLRRRIYYSSVLEPESVRDTDFVVPAEGGEDYTGFFVHRNALFIAEPFRIWRLFMTSMQGRMSENTKPGVGIQHVTYRGLVNQRCVARGGDFLYLMDQDGIYVFDGAGAKDISQPIQDFFRDGRINWAAAEWFFASADDAAKVVMFHLALGDGYLPHFALVYHTGIQRWECIEDYPWKLGCAVTAPLQHGWETLYGSEYGKFLVRTGTLDGPTERTVRGTATVGSPLSVVDDSADAVLPVAGVVGASLALVSGPGAGQRSRIVSSASGVLTVKEEFYEQPTDETVYQVGGVPWIAKTGIYRIPPDPIKEPREIVVFAEPTQEAATINVTRYLDHATAGERHVVDENLGLGVSHAKDADISEMSLKRSQERGLFTGRRHWKLGGYTHAQLDNNRFLQVELSGVQGMDPVKVYGMTLGGVTEDM